MESSKLFRSCGVSMNIFSAHVFLSFFFVCSEIWHFWFFTNNLSIIYYFSVFISYFIFWFQWIVRCFCYFFFAINVLVFLVVEKISMQGFLWRRSINISYVIIVSCCHISFNSWFGTNDVINVHLISDESRNRWFKHSETL